MRNRVHHNPIVGNKVEFKELCEETKGTRTVAEITLKPGGSIPIHYHNEFSEYYEVLDGELTIRYNDSIKTLKKGEYILIPIKVNHNYANTSDKPVHFKVVIQPGNIGYQLLVAVLNGLARDGKATKKGLPKNPFVFGYVSVAAGSNIPGVMSFFQPVLNWLHDVAVKRGIDKQLLAKYYKEIDGNFL